MFGRGSSVCFYKIEVTQKRESLFTFIGWVRWQVSYSPTYQTEPREREGERARILTGKWGRAQHANHGLPPKQTCEKFGRWSDERMKEEGMKGREGGREPVRWRERRDWIMRQKESTWVQFCWRVEGGGCSGGTWAPHRVCCLWEVLFIRTETGLTLKQESETQRWTFRGQQQSVWQKQWFCRSVPLGLVLSLWYRYLGPCVAPTQTGKYPHVTLLKIVTSSGKQPNKKQRQCSDTNSICRNFPLSVISTNILRFTY